MRPLILSLLALSSACASTPSQEGCNMVLGLEVPPHANVSGDLNSDKWLSVEVVYAVVQDKDYITTRARMGTVLAKTEAPTESETKTWRRKHILLARGKAGYAVDEGKQVPFISRLHFIPHTNSAKPYIETEPTGVVVVCDNRTGAILLSARYVGLDRMTETTVHEPKGNVMGVIETPHVSKEKGDMTVTEQWTPMSPRDYQGTGSRIVLFARIAAAIPQATGPWAAYGIKEE